MSDLFKAGAERAALASGRPLSQELAEIRHPQAVPFCAACEDDPSVGPHVLGCGYTGEVAK